MTLFRNVVVVSLVVAGLLLVGRTQAAGRVTDDLLGDLAAQITTASPDARRSPAATALALATAILPDLRWASPSSASDSLPPASENTGGTAITPTLPHNGNQPTFTTADAIAYAQTHSLRIASPVEITGSSAIFLSAAAAAEQLGTALLRPADAPICVVTLQGTFSSSHGPYSGSSQRSRIAHTVTLVFDAITGNLLMESLE